MNTRKAGDHELPLAFYRDYKGRAGDRRPAANTICREETGGANLVNAKLLRRMQDAIMQMR